MKNHAKSNYRISVKFGKSFVYVRKHNIFTENRSVDAFEIVSRYLWAT